jgi:hypothetical protein
MSFAFERPKPTSVARQRSQSGGGRAAASASNRGRAATEAQAEQRWGPPPQAPLSLLGLPEPVLEPEPEPEPVPEPEPEPELEPEQRMWRTRPPPGSALLPSRRVPAVAGASRNLAAGHSSGSGGGVAAGGRVTNGGAAVANAESLPLPPPPLLPFSDEEEADEWEDVPAAPAGVQARYAALAKQVISKDIHMTSASVGFLAVGEEIEVLAQRQFEGVVRVQCTRGWVSVRDSQNGRALLRLQKSGKAASMRRAVTATRTSVRFASAVNVWTAFQDDVLPPPPSAAPDALAGAARGTASVASGKKERLLRAKQERQRIAAEHVLQRQQQEPQAQPTGSPAERAVELAVSARPPVPPVPLKAAAVWPSLPKSPATGPHLSAKGSIAKLSREIVEQRECQQPEPETEPELEEATAADVDKWEDVPATPPVSDHRLSLSVRLATDPQPEQQQGPHSILEPELEPEPEQPLSTNWVSGAQAQALLDTLAWQRFATSDAAMVLEHQRNKSRSPTATQQDVQVQTDSQTQAVRLVDSTRRQQKVDEELMSLRQASVARFIALSPPVSSRVSPRTYSAYSVQAAQAADPSLVARHRLGEGSSWCRHYAQSSATWPVSHHQYEGSAELGMPPDGAAPRPANGRDQAQWEGGIATNESTGDLLVPVDRGGVNISPRNGSQHARREGLEDAIFASYALLERNENGRTSSNRSGLPPRQPTSTANVWPGPSLQRSGSASARSGAFDIPSPIGAAAQAASAEKEAVEEESRDSTFESVMGRLSEMEAKQLIQQRRLANFQRVYGGGVVIPRMWGSGGGPVVADSSVEVGALRL